VAVSGEHHPAFEEYCECIFELAEDDVDVIQARIAERLNVSRPAVSEMMRRLEGEGLITTDGGIALTDAGRNLAERVVRRHRLAERFLTDILQLSWAEAHHEAGKWEHVMSDAVEVAMAEVLGNPSTCPHGNPIPGMARPAVRFEPFPLAQAREGVTVVVERITEEAEADKNLLEYLWRHNVRPGRRLKITEVAPWAGTVTASGDGQSITLGLPAAGKIWVYLPEDS
jgi:DtxR family Mn-dependent transcriptional regulator